MKYKKSFYVILCLFMLNFTFAFDLSQVDVLVQNGGLVISHEQSDGIGEIYANDTLSNEISDKFDLSNQYIEIKNLKCDRQYELIYEHGDQIINFDSEFRTLNESIEIVSEDFDMSTNYQYVNTANFDLNLDVTAFSDLIVRLNGEEINYQPTLQNDPKKYKYNIELDTGLRQNILSITAKSCGREKEMEFIILYDYESPRLNVDSIIDEDNRLINFTLTSNEDAYVNVSNDLGFLSREVLVKNEPVVLSYDLREGENNFNFLAEDLAGNADDFSATINFDSIINPVEEFVPSIETSFIHAIQTLGGYTEAGADVTIYKMQKPFVEILMDQDGEYQELQEADNFEELFSNSNSDYILTEGSANYGINLSSSFTFDLFNQEETYHSVADQDGYFSFDTSLANGKNYFLMKIEDVAGNSLLQEFNVTKSAVDSAWIIEDFMSIPRITAQRLYSETDLYLTVNTLMKYNVNQELPKSISGRAIFRTDMGDNAIVSKSCNGNYCSVDADLNLYDEDSYYIRMKIPLDKEEIQRRYEENDLGDLRLEFKDVNLSVRIRLENRYTEPSLVPFHNFDVFVSGINSPIPPKIAKDFSEKLDESTEFIDEKILPNLKTAIMVDAGACGVTAGVGLLDYVQRSSEKASAEARGETYDGEPLDALKPTFAVCNRIICPTVPTKNSDGDYLVRFDEAGNVEGKPKVEFVSNIEQHYSDDSFTYRFAWKDPSGGFKEASRVISVRELCKYKADGSLTSSLEEKKEIYNQCILEHENDGASFLSTMNEEFNDYINSILISEGSLRNYQEEAPFYDDTRLLFPLDFLGDSEPRMINPYSGFVDSVRTGCIPGIYASTKRTSGVLDDVSECFKSLSDPVNNGDLSVCMKTFGYHVCDLISGAFNYAIPDLMSKGYSDSYSAEPADTFSEGNAVSQGTEFMSYFMSGLGVLGDSYSDVFANINGGTSGTFAGTVNHYCSAALDYDWSGSSSFLDGVFNFFVDSTLNAAEENSPPEVKVLGRTSLVEKMPGNNLKLLYTVSLWTSQNMVDKEIKQIRLTCSGGNRLCAGSSDEVLATNILVEDTMMSFDYEIGPSQTIYDTIEVVYEDWVNGVEKVEKGVAVDLNDNSFAQTIGCSINFNAGIINCGNPLDENYLGVNMAEDSFGRKATRFFPDDKLHVGDQVFFISHIRDVKNNALVEFTYPDVESLEEGSITKQCRLIAPTNDALFVFKIEDINAMGTEVCSEIGNYFLNTESLTINPSERFSINPFDATKYTVSGCSKSGRVSEFDDDDETAFRKAINDSCTLKTVTRNTDSGAPVLSIGDTDISFSINCNRYSYENVPTSFDVDYRFVFDTDSDGIGDINAISVSEDGNYDSLVGDKTFRIDSGSRTRSDVDLVYPTLYGNNVLPFLENSVRYNFLMLPRESKLNLSVKHFIGSVEEELLNATIVQEGFDFKTIIDNDNSEIDIGKDMLNYVVFKSDIMRQGSQFKLAYESFIDGESSMSASNFHNLQRDDSYNQGYAQGTSLVYIDLEEDCFRVSN